MPLNTTEIRVVLHAPASYAENLCRIAEQQHTAAQTHLEEPPDANPAIGAPSFIVVALFDNPENAKRFERNAKQYNATATQRRLTRDAVLSWLGQYVNVYFESGVGSGIAMHGKMEQINDGSVRLVPRANYAGLDLGPATYGSEHASDIPIDAIMEITPYF